MYSKCAKKIYVCSVILGQLESFRNYKGFSIIFRKILTAIYSSTKVTIFLTTLCIVFSIPKFLVSFLYKKQLNQGSEMGKIKLQKIVGNLFDKLLQIEHEQNGHPEIFSLPQSGCRKLQAIFASPNRYFTENSRWVSAPGFCSLFTATECEVAGYLQGCLYVQVMQCALVKL